MATAQNKPGVLLPVEEIFERSVAAQEQLAVAARSAGKRCLDTYEQVVDRTVDFDLKLAGATKQEWIREAAQQRAELTRDVARASAGAARTLLG